MRFQRLRLSGFKSFVEPVDVRIEAGLTGVVGPNGCGKSNLLEALRWVMGANSAKAMRAGEMDDVIFGGSGRRPARNHAEVLLVIDNADRSAPARFNDAAVIEVARRIDRGAGSTYRVNGVETRARDVQMLFADASTGANSPALVRQGQISELIAAKPANRRRILEEAAGVSGLHPRRHEATLRLDAAQANLARLDDVIGEIEGALNRLKREARKAEAYKRLSAEIRAMQGAALHARWRAAASAADQAASALTTADNDVAMTTQAAARAATAAVATSEALKPARDAESVAAAVLQRLHLEREARGRDRALAEAELARLKNEQPRNAADRAREIQAAEDAANALASLSAELDQIARASDPALQRLPMLEAALAAATVARSEADRAVEALAVEAAAQAVRRQAARDRAGQAQAASAGADTRLAEAHGRVARVAGALTTAREPAPAADAAGSLSTPALAAAVMRAETDLAVVRGALAAAEAVRQDAQAAEAHARSAAQTLDDDLRRLKTEAEGLLQLASSSAVKSPYPPVLDQVRPATGLERAVAAAFGETLEGALDPRAAAHWRPLDPPAPPHWPEGVAPLADAVTAPAPLVARLQRTGLVDRARGAALQNQLAPGEALVSREGDLWRWDGFVLCAEAPRPTAKRLAQKARLADIQAQVEALQPGAQAAARTSRDARAHLHAAELALASAHKAIEPAERALATAQRGRERLAQEAARREARAQALAESEARLAVELREAQIALTAADADAGQARALASQAKAAAAQAADAAPEVLADARTAAARARDAEARARADLDGDRRRREGRLRRRDALAKEQSDWLRRADDVNRRIAALKADHDRLTAALAHASEQPAALAAADAALRDQVQIAQTRRGAAADALARAETEAQDGDRAVRAADRAAGQAREGRATALARLEAAAERLEAAAVQLHDTTGLTPQALVERIAAEAYAIPTDPAGLETHLRTLERERDAMGPVNLRAGEEAGEQRDRLTALHAERSDLTSAITTLRQAVEALNAEGRERLLAAFAVIAASFRTLFETLFEGGQAELRLVESPDPLEAGLEILACPPGKRLAAMSLMSGGEQALTATALIFAVFLANPAPVCVLDEVDAPLDDANVDRFCRLLDEMRRRTDTRFITITHNPVTMSRMDRLFGVTMAEQGVSQLVSVDLRQAETLVA